MALLQVILRRRTLGHFDWKAESEAVDFMFIFMFILKSCIVKDNVINTTLSLYVTVYIYIYIYVVMHLITTFRSTTDHIRRWFYKIIT